MSLIIKILRFQQGLAGAGCAWISIGTYLQVKIFATTCQGLVGRVISQIPWDIVPGEYFKGDPQFRLWQRLALACTAWNSIITLTLKTFTTACLGLLTVRFLRDFVPCRYLRSCQAQFWLWILLTWLICGDASVT